jgi:segregation and condensation protein B
MDGPEDFEDSFAEMQPEYFLHRPEGEINGGEETLSTHDLERLYQQALRASEMLDAVERQLPELAADSGEAPVSREAGLPEAAVVNPETAPNSHRSDIRPARILEAALFVGGTTLTLKKLTRLLGDHLSEEFVEQEIQTLNAHYAAKRRPYEILFGEGGYRMVLKSEFDRIRNRVFGLGPKEVKLSQHLLELLAYVAYRQPVTPEQIEQTGRKNAGNLLNQLVRRELVSLERTGAGRKDVQYSTTDRFLEIFGLRSVDELPRPEELSFK